METKDAVALVELARPTGDNQDAWHYYVTERQALLSAVLLLTRYGFVITHKTKS